ncbi:lipopolysaccharide assembly protein LapA domain-containing protein [Bacillaceae bacterium IKA-2]|jgi:putative membrane protein|nr:lipopolysaccharide assembly protein LapA domain-containing protein [Bacillaceae bacterium IKA-2]
MKGKEAIKMKGQWGLIIGLIVSLLIAIFAVINMDVVSVNYVFGTAQWPLVIVIISSVLMGGILVGGVNIYGIHKLKNHLKNIELENDQFKIELAELKKKHVNSEKRNQIKSKNEMTTNRKT